MSKFTIRIIPFLFLISLIGASRANAQGGSIYFGAGSAWDGAGTTPGCASGNLFDPFTGISGQCEPAPTIGGAFGVFGADFMFKPHFGVSGEYAFRFAQAPYLPNAGLYMRPGFYDFNGIWEPSSGTDNHITPVLEAGIGGARIPLYVSQTSCVTSICSNFSSPAGFNANHFQVHFGAGVKVYIKGNVFIKPQFDLHYVTNLTDQFARNWVPQATISIGYTFGGR